MTWQTSIWMKNSRICHFIQIADGARHPTRTYSDIAVFGTLPPKLISYNEFCPPANCPEPNCDELRCKHHRIEVDQLQFRDFQFPGISKNRSIGKLSIHVLMKDYSAFEHLVQVFTVRWKIYRLIQREFKRWNDTKWSKLTIQSHRDTILLQHVNEWRSPSIRNFSTNHPRFAVSFETEMPFCLPQTPACTYHVYRPRCRSICSNSFRKLLKLVFLFATFNVKLQIVDNKFGLYMYTGI